MKLVAEFPEFTTKGATKERFYFNISSMVGEI